MYAAIVSATAVPGKLEEATRIYREVNVPLLKQQKGYTGGYLLVDRETGKSISIGLWESEADAQAFESSGAFQAVVAKFTGLMTEVSKRELYEVVLKI